MMIPITAKTTTTTSETAKNIKLKKACQEFEGQFFAMMLQEMRKTVPTDPILGDDANQGQIFQGMMDDNVAQTMAAKGGANDLAAQMYKQLSSQGKTTLSVQQEAGISTALPINTLKTSTEKADNNNDE